MKMHAKPAKRHRSYVAPVKADVMYDSKTPQPFHILFTHGDGSTQRLVMTEKDALRLTVNLAAMLRYRDWPIAEVAVAELTDFLDDIKELTEYRQGEQS